MQEYNPDKAAKLTARQYPIPQPGKLKIQVHPPDFQEPPTMILDCASFKTKSLYHLLTATVAPRPIAWVSTLGEDGTSNLAPFSFYNVFCIAPPVLGFAPGYRDAKKLPKDTLRNIQATGEFTVNFVDESLMLAMNETSAELPQHLSEFTFSKLESAPGAFNHCPRVRAAKVSLECTLRQIIDLEGSALILGNIRYLHIQDDLLKEAVQKKKESQEQKPARQQERPADENLDLSAGIRTDVFHDNTQSAQHTNAPKDENEADLECLKKLLLSGEIELDASILRPVGRLGGNQYLTLEGLQDIPRPSRR